MTRAHLIFGIGLASIIGGAAVMSQTTIPTQTGLFPYEDPSAVAMGAEIYEVSCAACHGANLEGQANWRSERSAQGRALAPPHDVTGHTWHHPEEQLFAITKWGTAAIVGNGYESDMMGFEGVLSDEEILAVLAFIKASWPNEIIEQHNEMSAQN